MLLNVLLSFIKNKIIEIQRLHCPTKKIKIVCLLDFFELDLYICLIFFLLKIIFCQKNFCIIFLIFNKILLTVNYLCCSNFEDYKIKY